MPSFDGVPDEIILASASPRRRQIFACLFGSDGFRAVDNPFDEASIRNSFTHRRFVARVSAAKCRAFLRRYEEGADCFVVTADTIVVRGRRRLGKPADAQEAKAMLRTLSGRWHHVLTAVSLASSRQGIIHTQVERTRIRFAALTTRQIESYVASGKPMDKAGAYGIQELPSAWVLRIRGCYQNVVGLPVCRLLRMIKRYGQSAGSHVKLADHLLCKQKTRSGGTYDATNNQTPDQRHP